MLNKEKIILWIEKLFPLFLLGQVIIDIITTIFITKLKISISFGMIIRFLFLLLAIIYIFIKGKKISKVLLILIILMNIYQFLYLYFVLADFNIFMNLRYQLKAIYYAIMVLFLYCYKDKIDKEQIFNIININMFLIFLVYVISAITKTNLLMYRNDMVGSSGWFSSGNEISTTVSMLSLVILYIFINKQTIFHFITLIGTMIVLILMGTKTSLIILIVLSFLSVVLLSYLVIKRKKGYYYLALLLVTIISFCFLCKQFPAIKNIEYVKEIQKETAYKNTFSENDQLSEETIRKRYVSQPLDDIDSFVSSITFSVLQEETNKESNIFLVADGYVYPKYFDVSHPKYIEKKLVFYNSKEELVFPLTDTYNRYVVEQLTRNYNGEFSGINGKFNFNNFNSNVDYDIAVIIDIDGFTKKYEINDEMVLKQNAKILKLDDGKISIDKEKAVANFTSDGKGNCKVTKLKLPWMSGRLERVVDFVTCNENYGTFQILFGSGTIYNFVESKGFEMDILEVFVVFGFVGFIIYFAITVKLFISILINVIKKPKIVLKNNNYLLIISLFLGFGIALIVGHAILTPSPAIYLSVLLIVISKIIEEGFNEANNKKNT